ncbi:uncharacterized protein LOC128884432 isoform X2 [Hylaeus volcanicus]|uniref:uncharacterized protein LOC128884432 isoform X2 n=1 Tax=Hylaeus volcanicus TaxID=313075 RepID=UPI0023B84633|nr:uncharacterized protein LOC128884432 isoform X2 [Hylaeus volcanicus]
MNGKKKVGDIDALQMNTFEASEQHTKNKLTETSVSTDGEQESQATIIKPKRTYRKRVRSGGINKSKKNNSIVLLENNNLPENEIVGERRKELTLWDLVMKKGRSSKTSKDKQEKTCEQDLSLYDATQDIGLFSNVMSKACTKSFETHPMETLQDLFGPNNQSLTQNDYIETPKSIGTSKKKELQESLRLDEDGNLLLDDALFFNKADNSMSNFLMEGRMVVSENYTEGHRTLPFSGAYKRTKASKWTTSDEETFYKALATFGLDLMMVGTWLPHFSSRQIKDKYRTEEKKNLKRIEDALQKRDVITVNNFEMLHGQIDERTHFKPENDSDNAYSTANSQEADNAKSSPVTCKSSFDDLFQLSDTTKMVEHNETEFFDVFDYS